MDDDKLIMEVRNRPYIWDKSDRNHFNRDLLADAWETIANAIGGGVSGSQCKTRWTSVKDYFFRKHKQFLSTRPGQSTSRMKKWHLYDYLTFLAPTASPSTNPTSGNHFVTYNIDEDSDSSIVDQTQAHLLTNPLSFIAEDTSVGTLPDCSSSSSYPTKRKNTEFDEEERELQNRMLKGSSSEPIHQLDENEHFFKSLLPSLKNLDEFETMQFRIDVQELALNYMQRAWTRKQNEPASAPPNDMGSIPNLSGNAQPVQTVPTPSMSDSIKQSASPCAANGSAVSYHQYS